MTITLAEIKNRLESVLGANKVAYRQFPLSKAPSLPWAVYYTEGTSNFNADGSTYAIINNITIELYTDNKNIVLETEIESAFSDIPWEKTEEYIDTEKMLQISYSMEI